MKAPIIAVVAVVVLIGGVCGGYARGHSRGEKVGYDQGYAIGRSGGEKAGYDQGYEAGWELGRNIGHKEGSTEGYNKAWVDCIREYGGGECSVIEFWSDWLDRRLDEYRKLRISARVMNVGDDGAFTVQAEVSEGDVHGTRSRSSKIYLKKGQETIVNFDFWVDGRFSYVVWCLR